MVQDLRTLPLPALVSFQAVARHGGISAAAGQLGLAKSAVSRHVAQLEAHFGVRLLERGGRRVRLTPVGERLAARVRSILAEIDLLQDLAREERAGVAGQVTVAGTPEFGGLVATRVFPQILARHPDLSLVLRPAYAFEDMQDPATDLAFRIGSFRDDRLVARRLGGFRRRLVAAPGLLDRYPVGRPEDLAAVPCLIFRGDHAAARWELEGPGGAVAVEVTGRLAVRGFAILLELAAAGQGIAFLPDFLTVPALAEGRLVPCLAGWASPEVPVFLTFRPGARAIARTAAVIAAVEDLVPPLLAGVASAG